MRPTLKWSAPHFIFRAGTALDTDVQSNYVVTVIASDSSLSGSTPVTTSFTLTVSEVNFAPTAVHLSSTLAAVAEDADTSSRTRVAHIQITDDGAGTNIVSLAGADADQFEVVGDSLYLKANRACSIMRRSGQLQRDSPCRRQCDWQSGYRGHDARHYRRQRCTGGRESGECSHFTLR